MWKVGQKIYGSGEWQSIFPKGKEFTIKKIWKRGTFSGCEQFSVYIEEVEDYIPEKNSRGQGWYDNWFTEEKPGTSMRVVRD